MNSLKNTRKRSKNNRNEFKYKELKQECYEANMQYALDLVIYTFGNVSAVDSETGVFAIKPSGVPYDNLKPEDIVIVDFDNNIIEGICDLPLILKPMHFFTKIGRRLAELLIPMHLFGSLGPGTAGYSYIWNHTCRSSYR